MSDYIGNVPVPVLFGERLNPGFNGSPGRRAACPADPGRLLRRLPVGPAVVAGAGHPALPGPAGHRLRQGLVPAAVLLRPIRPISRPAPNPPPYGGGSPTSGGDGSTLGPRTRIADGVSDPDRAPTSPAGGASRPRRQTPLRELIAHVGVVRFGASRFLKELGSLNRGPPASRRLYCDSPVRTP